MTKELEIQNGNKLIAEFMGARLSERNGELAVFLSDHPLSKEYFRVTRYNRYHEDWNELMGVYYKLSIELMGDFSGKNQDYVNGIVNWLNQINTVFINPDYVTPAEHVKAVWEIHIQFIQWYNTSLTPKSKEQ